MSDSKHRKPLSSSNARNLLISLEKLKLEHEELINLVESNPEKLSSQLAPIPAWFSYFDHPLISFLYVFLQTLDIIETFEKLAGSEDPNTMIIQSMLAGIESPLDPNTLSLEKKSKILSMLSALESNIDSYMQYGLSLNALLEKSSEDDAHLFKAIRIDRTVISCTSIAVRITEAEMRGDSEFFKKLSKALTQTKPQRSSEELDFLRFFLAAFEESGTFASMSHEDLYSLLVEDLQLYPDTGKDPMSGMIKQKHKVRSMHRK